MHADGIRKREIARRLGISRNTVDRLLEAKEPPRYSRAPAGSMLDPLEGVLRRLVEEWPEIKAPRVTEILREDHGTRGRLIWSASVWRGCGRRRCGRRSGRAIARRKCCS